LLPAGASPLAESHARLSWLRAARVRWVSFQRLPRWGRGQGFSALPWQAVPTRCPW
jgi:hypothetical protein